jgi:PST family polysaccharide transporter
MPDKITNNCSLALPKTLQVSVELCPTPAINDVGRLARSGAKWSVAMMIARQIISLATTAVLSRILPASDFGAVAMVGTLTNFLLLISDMGLSWATVQKERIEQEQIDLVFWTGTALGVGAWAACALGGQILADFYNTAELVPLCWIFGISLFINGVGIQPTALLKRQMRQRELNISQTVAVLVAGVVAVIFALAGARYWALAAQSIATSLILLILSFYWSGYRPGFPRHYARAMSLLKFGGYVGVFNIVTYLQVNIDNILVGRYCGANELGFYSRAYILRTLPALYAAMALTDVMVPALSAIQGDHDRLERAFSKAVRLIAFVGCPIAVGLGVTSEETVLIIYGPAWAPVVPLLIWLSLPAIILPLTQTMGWIFIASGKVRQMLILSTSTLPVVLIFYYVAVRWGGAKGVAIAAAALYTVPLPLITFYFAHTAAGLSLRKTLKEVMPILFSCAGSAAAALAAGYAVASWGGHWTVVFATKLLTGAFSYLTLAIFLVRPIPISQLEHLAVTVRRILNRYVGTSGSNDSGTPTENN